MPRVNTKIGDVFSVRVDENSKKYFQLIAFDLYQLNSEVISAFKKVYPIDANPSPPEIVKGEVEFYAHCETKLGTKMRLWEKVGNIADVGKANHILFRDTSDYGYKRGEEPVKISEKWYVWRLGDLHPVRVGRLEGENRKAEIGLIFNPLTIVARIKTGKYLNHNVYPGFE